MTPDSISPYLVPFISDMLNHQVSPFCSVFPVGPVCCYSQFDGLSQQASNARRNFEQFRSNF